MSTTAHRTHKRPSVFSFRFWVNHAILFPYFHYKDHTIQIVQKSYTNILHNTHTKFQTPKYGKYRKFQGAAANELRKYPSVKDLSSDCFCHCLKSCDRNLINHVSNIVSACNILMISINIIIDLNLLSSSFLLSKENLSLHFLQFIFRFMICFQIFVDKCCQVLQA